MSSQSSPLEAALGDRYRLVRELGRGGTATVWLAEDRRHGREVALKVLHPEVAATLGTRRFLREIEIAAKLSHPNILPLHEAGDAGGLPYYVMPVVQGESLRDRLRREIQLPVDEALRIAMEVADGLSYAHERGVVHRDVKPENILLQSGHAVIADFGVAKALAIAGREVLTGTGLAVGTPAYMSPEQAAGSDHVDARTDIYALGCVLFEMLAGEPPFSARTPQALAAKHLQAPPPKVRLTRNTVPAALDRVIERALAKVPADRFPTAGDFGKALAQASSMAAPSPEFPKPARRTALIVAGVALMLVVAAAVLWPLLRLTQPVPSDARVVVFPLRAVGPGLNPFQGEALATIVGYALEGSEPLRWLDGWDYLTQRERQALDSVSMQRAAQVSRDASARYFVDGSVLQAGESLAVVLRLHDVIGDSVVARAGASQPVGSADPPLLALRAVSELLPALVEPGRRVDLRYLGDRKPAAIASFLQGERSYRRMRFDLALASYKRALSADSLLAVAAIKGAQSALLLERYDEAHQLAELVLAGEDALSLRYRSFAAGLLAFLDGKADSAAAAFRRAAETDESSAEAWTALGETYYHLLPSSGYSDDSTEQAFLRAEAADSMFSPALTHLAHFAIRRGDLDRATRLVERLGQAEPEGSDALRRLDIMLRCARDGPSAVDWRRALEDSAIVLPVARLLSAGGRQAACAEAAYRAQWSDPRASHLRWGTLLGLTSILAAQGKTNELKSLLDSEAASGLHQGFLYLLTASARIGGDTKAADVAGSYSLGSAPDAWLIGEWQASRGDSQGLARTLDSLTAFRDRSHRREDSVMVAALHARRVLLSGDTALAVDLLKDLTPSGPPAKIEWDLWESYAPERLVLAEVLTKQGRWTEAQAVAAQFDSPASVIYTMYAGLGLRIRFRAAEASGNTERARLLRARLRSLGGR